MMQNPKLARRTTYPDIERRSAERRKSSGNAVAHIVELATMVLDKSGIIRYCNAAAARLFRADTLELARRHITALIPSLPFNAETPGYNVAYATFWATGGRWRVFGGKDSAGRSVWLHVLLDKLELEGGHQILLNLRQVAGVELFRSASRQIYLRGLCAVESVSMGMNPAQCQSWGN
jgi:PAS domain-containing protein